MEILKIKTRNRRVGDIGEREAVKLLKRKKFKIIKRNYVAVNHEIDIIAENKEYQIFVESNIAPILNEDVKNIFAFSSFVFSFNALVYAD